jgi:hypothetical protein
MLTGSGSILGSLPQQDDSESFLSFNTTATNSNPSQFPPPTFDPPTSSLYNLPPWRISLSRLTPLAALLKDKGKGKGKAGKVDLIVCVVGVERVRVVQRAEEKRKGQEGSLWVGKWDVISQGEGGDGEVGCGVQLWDRCARDWGEERVRRGDVVLLESV